MELVVDPGGTIRCVYSEELDLHEFGKLFIERGSHVEPTLDGQWTADLSPVEGPSLGPYSKRSLAIDAELKWLATNWLAGDAGKKGAGRRELRRPAI